MVEEKKTILTMARAKRPMIKFAEMIIVLLKLKTLVFLDHFSILSFSSIKSLFVTANTQSTYTYSRWIVVSSLEMKPKKIILKNNFISLINQLLFFYFERDKLHSFEIHPSSFQDSIPIQFHSPKRRNCWKFECYFLSDVIEVKNMNKKFFSKISSYIVCDRVWKNKNAMKILMNV